MKIKDIEDPKVQQMAVVETIKDNLDCTLDHVLEVDLLNAFTWRKSPQTDSFWYKIYNGAAPVYTDKDLWYKCIKGNVDRRFITNKLYQCQNDLFETAKAFIDEKGFPSGFIINSNNFILATPEEVYNRLKQKDMNNSTYGKKTIYTQEEPEVQKDASTLQEPQERESTRSLLNGALDKIIILEEEKKDLTSKLDAINDMIYCSNKGFQSKIKELEEENEKLNKLVDEIEEELTKRAGNVFYPQIDLIELIHNYRNPSLVGTTQQVEIDGKKYEVTINKQI